MCEIEENLIMINTDICISKDEKIILQMNNGLVQSLLNDLIIFQNAIKNINKTIDIFNSKNMGYKAKRKNYYLINIYFIYFWKTFKI